MDMDTLPVSKRHNAYSDSEIDLEEVAVEILDDYVDQMYAGDVFNAYTALRKEEAVGKLDVHHLAKLTEYLLYHGFVTSFGIDGYMTGIVDILGAIAKHYKSDKKMTAKIQKDIVTGIETFTKARVAEGYTGDYWDLIAPIVSGMFDQGNAFEMHMFKPLFLYADKQGRKQPVAYELAMYFLNDRKEFGFWDEQSLPGWLHEYCPRLARDKAKLNYFIKVLTGIPDCPDRSVWKEQGDKHHRNKEYQRAIEAYTKGLSVNRAFHPILVAEHYCNRAASKVMIKDFKSAVDDCTAALEINEYYKQAYICGCECLLALHKPGQALQWLKKYNIDIGAEKGKLVAKAKADLVDMVEKGKNEKKDGGTDGGCDKENL